MYAGRFRLVGLTLLLTASVIVLSSIESARAQAPADTLTKPSPPAMEYVKRAGFTSGIEDREPVDEVDSLKSGEEKIFYFSEIVNMEGRTITHRWSRDGKKMADVTFEIGGPRWRVYSSKNIMPDWVGRWTVQVVDDAGNVLRVDSFAYVHARQ